LKKKICSTEWQKKKRGSEANIDPGERRNVRICRHKKIRMGAIVGGCCRSLLPILLFATVGCAMMTATPAKPRRD
jgi:hypothetical protein